MPIMPWNADAYPYASRRTVVFGQHGMVATSQPLAAQAGLAAFAGGGNAVDAAVAMAACLTVVEPTSNGIGGDAFALVWSQGKLFGLNASGPAPAGASLERIRALGRTQIPAHGWDPVTVPGIPSAWHALSERFGRLSMAQTLAPAIERAEDGYPVSPVVAHYWQQAHHSFLRTLTQPQFSEWFRVFAPGGVAPGPGTLWRSPDHAATLREIARTNAESFYRGSLAARIEEFSRATGGTLRASDLANYHPEWQDPISVSFADFDVWEMPPNGQGLVALMALKMLNNWGSASEEELVHRQIEILKLCFADAERYLADLRHMPVTPRDLLDDAYLRGRRSLIGQEAQIRQAGKPTPGGTVYLATADNEGNMVSYIQSNYAGFGSGLVVPGTGIALQDRGQLFSLEPGHPNALAPGKRPYHTIIPGFLTRGGQPIGPFGVMGGFMQPQGHVQVLSRMLVAGLNPQAALDAPRFFWEGGNHVVVERAMPSAVVDGLRRRGHDVEISDEPGFFGRGEIIWRMENGIFAGATEPRADGSVLGW